MPSGTTCDQISWNNLNEITWDYFSDINWDNFVFYFSKASIQQFYYNVSYGAIKITPNAVPSFRIGTYIANSGEILPQVKITKGFDAKTRNIKISTSIKE